jgi:hypothetical protein
MKPINYRSFSFYILPFYISLSAIDVSTTFLSPFGLCQRNVVIYVLIAITVITDSVARYKVVALLLSFFLSYPGCGSPHHASRSEVHQAAAVVHCVGAQDRSMCSRATQAIGIRKRICHSLQHIL